jgi:hypothetical protein
MRLTRPIDEFTDRPRSPQNPVRMASVLRRPVPAFMLYNIEHKGAAMPRGTSGRIVVEIDPALKRRLYSVLAEKGFTLKGWFVSAANELVDQHRQPRLSLNLPKKTREDGNA